MDNITRHDLTVLMYYMQENAVKEASEYRMDTAKLLQSYAQDILEILCREEELREQD